MEPLVSGTGEAALNRFAYNALTRQCLPFVYSGIGGNQNNFLSKASCEASCPGKCTIIKCKILAVMQLIHLLAFVSIRNLCRVGAERWKEGQGRGETHDSMDVLLLRARLLVPLSYGFYLWNGEMEQQRRGVPRIILNCKTFSSKYPEIRRLSKIVRSRKCQNGHQPKKFRSDALQISGEHKI